MKLDARVVLLKNRGVRVAFPRESVGARLAHSDPVAPSSTGENECDNLATRVGLPIDYEQVLLQSERGTDLGTTQSRATFIARHLNFGYTARRAERSVNRGAIL